MDFGSRRESAGGGQAPRATDLEEIRPDHESGVTREQEGAARPIVIERSGESTVVADPSGVTPYYRDEQGHIHILW